ncbi:putative Transcriptional regulator [Bradyrhizobium diazoefficiens SEMIA 5080]|uniref:Putative Transcriptional regulator n=1 Tax=Bradyrhizobium diazoefficiens SEMIA 5080 TaxID=754504 RepID=A0A837CKR2_9BRAD|nr:putative Transcriptional regulator [Bradyrhizobium diazoefficiens SEMIA 5080]
MRRMNTNELERQAKGVAALMRMLANEHRLLIVCKLVEYGEISATSSTGRGRSSTAARIPISRTPSSTSRPS